MSERAFSPLPTEIDLPAVEREILDRWRSTEVFRRSLEQTADGPSWGFFEGPPTANGKPGTHHVEARVFKDLFPRFKTMKGHHVERRAGWDCHGLPVELAVEKELGFTKKQDIEAYGIAEFNARCRESALRNVADFAAMTERMGYWVDLDNAYLTMAPTYVESVWWSLKQVFDKGLLVEDHRVTPYCPRDETPLSDHEVAQGYQDDVDPSVYVRFPLASGPWQGANLLVWTTTPWTLPSNTAVAVHPEATYALAEHEGEKIVAAEPLLPESAAVIDRMTGQQLAGASYERPLDLVPLSEFGDEAFRVFTADYVTMDSGTGIVHLAPAFGAEDMAVGRQHGLPMVNPIGLDGHFLQDVPLIGGLFFRDANDTVIEQLARKGLLVKHEPYPHSYPHCWRCGTALIYYALPSWFIRTTEIKDRLVAENERTDWHPAHIKHGRYGAWLNNNVDWALSRNRFWGTPLPIWRCEDNHLTCVGSLKELSTLAGEDLTELDPHRPFVDEISFPCPECRAEARRVPQVIDVWYDSGAMPFAQWGAPHRNQAEFEVSYPAQYICEAIDQTRGWFYSMMTVGTLVFDKSSYETVLCLGLILDADGRKMSKHLGNILDPFDLFDRYGADTVRWLMLAGGSPWVDRRVGDEVLSEIVRKVLLTYWNAASFLLRYADLADWRPGEPVTDRHVMDRWLLAELHGVVADVDAALEDFDSATAGRRLAGFIDDLSNWYIRRSRRRFWQAEPSAMATLHETLDVLTRLMAPFVPFVTDYLWQHLHADADSVHLAAWPEAAGLPADPALVAQMRLVRDLVELGRSTRAANKIRTRQPLARAMVHAPGFADLDADLRGQIAEELNVRAVEPMTTDLVEVTVKPNFRVLGKRFGPRMQQLAKAIAAAGTPVDGTLTVTLDGETITLAGDDLVLTEQPRKGWAVTTVNGTSVALDLELDEELTLAGLARDALRLVQDTRKSAGLDIADRIRLWWTSDREDVAAALRRHRDLLAEEVLAVDITEGPGENEATVFGELSLRVWLAKV
ncbi:isoleucine--tRNA ligase [Kutzneria sp. 744]|uniref:isoleucine--tRNA ligase n=1 Tax=Kutzneria sp. (strain 744) TaxID=345341 RepID=UPI0003EECBA9|nr:isoleucine--tRNA ligase [Kutzneria sp. 744]EWM19290.1 isoleucyl-tRNA synthetase [Kutzneria sp. 744]